MFTIQQLDRYADVLVWGMRKARTGRFKKNDIVMVRYNPAALPLAEKLQVKLLDMRLNPIVRMTGTAGMEKAFFERANSAQLVFEPPGERRLYMNLNGSIFLNAPESLTHLQHIDSSKIARTAIARKPLRDIIFKREEQGLFGWTLCSCTTAELAGHAGMSEKDYTGQIVKACYLNRRDPVGQWEEIFRRARTLKKWLTAMPAKSYHIESRKIDLNIDRGEQRRWIGISGHNIPSFELFLSPDWHGTRGVYYADQPSYRNGNIVSGVRLEFKNGRVIAMDAEQNRRFVEQQLGMDDGAKALGEFSLTDTRFSKIDRFMADTLFDENYGGKYGNCHVALGASYSDTFSGDVSHLTQKKKQKLGFNDSALHWDLVNTEDKTVTACLKNGKRNVIYEKGRFCY